MRCWIELDAQALLWNYRTFCQLTQPAIAIPIVKSNAYGHGLDQVFQILSSDNPLWIGVNYPEEGVQLRQLGYQGRILVVGPIDPKLLACCYEEKLDIVLGDFCSLANWQKMEKRPLAHIKIDTGMSRQGFLPEEIEQLIQKIQSHERRDLYGICSHFANVEDVLNHDYAMQQLDRFQKAQLQFKKAGLNLTAHIASSASALIVEQSLNAMARIGISLYGQWPSGKTRLSYLQNHPKIPELKPVLSWYTEVAMTKKVKEGEFIGYGCTYRAIQNMNVAVLPVGYYEGYPRLASGRGSYVLIQGKRCPIVGRICMNMMMVDISHLNGIQAGEKVTLIGRDGEEMVSADDLAAWSETIHYELLTRLNPSIPRHIKKVSRHEENLS